MTGVARQFFLFDVRVMRELRVINTRLWRLSLRRCAPPILPSLRARIEIGSEEKYEECRQEAQKAHIAFPNCSVHSVRFCGGPPAKPVVVFQYLATLNKPEQPEIK